ncbi:ABC transporter substrate-binding protein [Aquabacter spiritensis]|uniref:Putative ABC transport system substrate-binding protein n=1 Tax=Aquabacter spiritensis TaxID=933073 RepID=A0A4R3M5W6_9HYPH|nr:ABC transporter substrate-binding protein [Aquabacter spiritensis]TCT07993.1 putative ABC transport system substrate-binding protein [Aquabacter spiritensis]
MIDRRSLLSLGLGAGAAGMIGTAAARAQSKPFRILMLTFRGETEVDRGFREFIQAADVQAEFIVRDANRDPRNVPGLIADLATLKPDLIYTWGTPVTLGVVGPIGNTDPRYVRDIPVVFALVAAPVRAGIAASFESSGRNVTGAVHVVPTDVQLRAMQAYLPFETIGILYTPTEQNSVVIVEEAKAVADKMGGRVIAQPFRADANGRPTADGVADMIKQMRADKVSWLYLLPDTFLGSIYDKVTPAALDVGLPTFAAAELGVREGGALVGLVSRYYSVGQLAGAKAIEILVHKRRPQDVPIETLKRFSLIINMRIARTLGIYPPISMLNYAEVVTS